MRYGSLFKKNYRMKRILSFLAVAAALCCCTKPESILPVIEEEPMAPLELKLATQAVTKAMIKESRLPDPSSVGITVRDSYGAYAGEEYTNIKYTSKDASGAQVWECDSHIMLSPQTGT